MFANLAPTLTLGPNNLTGTLKIDIKTFLVMSFLVTPLFEIYESCPIPLRGAG